MGLGSTAKKVQKMVEMAEELYAKMNELRAQVRELRETVETTADRVSELETENEKQRALVEALAREEGVDVESVLAGIEADETAGSETADSGTAGSEKQEAGARSESDTGDGSAAPEPDA